MNNEIGRKLTSLTLMTIMFAGGLTIAAPTMFPETDAQSSSMLSVSTTSLQGGAILEIVVDDPDLKILDSPISAPLGPIFTLTIPQSDPFCPINFSVSIKSLEKMHDAKP